VVGIQEIENPIDLRVGIKPVAIVPEVIPRKLGEKAVTREEAAGRGEETVEKLDESLKADSRILSVSVVETWKDVLALEEDLRETDAFWVIGAGRGRAALILDIARRYRKPMIGGGGTGLPPFLRSRNLEAYLSVDNDLISLLRARKAIRQTRVLVVASRRIPSCLSSVWNLEDMESRFGIGFETISDEAFFAEMDRVDWEKAKEIADELIAGAEEVCLDRKHVVKSAGLYLAGRSLMGRYGCNALSVRCCEHPFLDLEMEHETTPCLAAALMNDRGLPASCQGDLSGVLTIAMLMHVSKSSVFLGNIGLPTPGENIISINHSEPGLRMNSLQSDILPYSLHSFGVMDWGTAIYVDMTKCRKGEMTVARCDPLAKRLLLTKGQVVRSFPVEEYCKQMVHIEVPDASHFVERAHTDYGAHLVATCGDHTESVKRLACLLGLEVEYV
jgi:L-fucose isomerase-like protein